MGAPLKPDRDRYSNGRIKPNQSGTPETLAKHHARATLYRIPASKDPGYAESTIGVLEARGLIEPDVARKLIAMRETFERLFGRGVPSGSSIERTYGSGSSKGEPEETKHLREQWTAYKQAIERITPRARRDEFENVILRNRFRQWMTLPRLVWHDGTQPDWQRLQETVQNVVGQGARAAGMSDSHANAMGLGKTLDELYR